MEPEIHKNALKHLSREEVISAWGNVVKCIQRASDDEPPRWLCVGWLPDGRSVELVAVETIFGWLIITRTARYSRNSLGRFRRRRGEHDEQLRSCERPGIHRYDD